MDALINLLRGHDPGASGARNPHVLPCTFRFLRSGRTRLMPGAWLLPLQRHYNHGLPFAGARYDF